MKAYSLTTQEGDVYADSESLDYIMEYLVQGLGTMKGARLWQMLADNQEDLVSDYLKRYGLTLTVEDVKE